MKKKLKQSTININEDTKKELMSSLSDLGLAKKKMTQAQKEVAFFEGQMNSKLRLIFSLNNKPYPKSGNIQMSEDGKRLIYDSLEG